MVDLLWFTRACSLPADTLTALLVSPGFRGCSRSDTLVRVRQMVQPNESYDPWGLNQRSPRVGDVGVLVDVLRAPGAPDRYVVELSGSGGVSVWLAEFLAEELESAA